MNDRYIRSPLIGNAVIHAYGERLLKGTYPLYALHLKLDASDVDVNVHPNKLSVHFRDEGAIEYIVGSAVGDAIRKNEYTPVITTAAGENEPSAAVAEEEPEEPADDAIFEKSESDIPEVKIEIDAPTLPDDSFGHIEIRQEAGIHDEVIKYPDIGLINASEPEPSDDFSLPAEKEPEKREQIPLMRDVTAYKVIGSVFDSYVIIESGNNMYLIDQHAAHERMIYDSLCRAAENKAAKQMLIGETVSLSAEDTAIAAENTEYFKKLGVDIAVNGATECVVTSVPQIFGQVQPRRIVEDIIEALKGAASPKLRIETIAEILARKACRRAIKAGYRMNDDEIGALVEDIIKNGSIPNCPHGRPVAVAMSKGDIEKSFKRRL